MRQSKNTIKLINKMKKINSISKIKKINKIRTNDKSVNKIRNINKIKRIKKIFSNFRLSCYDTLKFQNIISNGLKTYVTNIESIKSIESDECINLENIILEDFPNDNNDRMIYAIDKCDYEKIESFFEKLIKTFYLLNSIKNIDCQKFIKNKLQKYPDIMYDAFNICNMIYTKYKGTQIDTFIIFTSASLCDKANNITDSLSLQNATVEIQNSYFVFCKIIMDNISTK